MPIPDRNTLGAGFENRLKAALDRVTPPSPLTEPPLPEPASAPEPKVEPKVEPKPEVKVEAAPPVGDN